MSVQNFDKDYVVQTGNIAQHFHEHNKGNGAKETSNPYYYYHPCCVSAYICSLSHMDQYTRECLEDTWKRYNADILLQGRTDIQSHINQGHHVVDNYN